MKLKLIATIKKEALLPGMEMAIQDVDLQKELNKPGIVQQVNESDQALDQALKQLKGKYPNKGDWDEQDLITALESVMKKSNIPFGIGAREPNPLGDIGYQRRMAINDALLDLARNFGPDKNKNVTNVTLSGFGGRVFFTNADGYVYVLVY